MARRLIGLDVGTNAVTVAEVTAGEPPRLDLFAQVALPRDAMREGEVVNEAAVTEAVQRLRAEVGLKKAGVRVGIASPRVIVRQVDMPAMTREELASALQFQAADLIPIPIEDAVLDFAILGRDTSPEGEQTMRVLLAAAQAATVARLVDAVEAGGLPVAAVDLAPLALTRALARNVPVPVLEPVGAGAPASDGVGAAEGIVSFGGGVTAITVHEGGVPRFVRVLGTGGRELTDAITSELEIPPETAEALKRQLASGAQDDLVVRARTAIERPLSVLLDDVRSSIDYYRNQPGANRLTRIVATGGSSQLPGLPERMSALVGVPVELAHPRDVIAIGDIGFPPDELPRLDPYLPAAVGLALGGAGVGTVVDLLPRNRPKTSGSKKVSFKLDPRAGVAAAAALVVLGGATFVVHHSVSAQKSKKASVLAQNQDLQSQIARYSSVQAATGQIAAVKSEMATLLASDVAWTTLLDHLAHDLPAGVTIGNFQGQVTTPPPTAAAAAPTAAPATDSSGSQTLASSTPTSTPTGAATTPAVTPTAPLNGTLTFSGTAPDVPSVSAFIDALTRDAAVSDAWVSNLQHVEQDDGTEVVKFSATATLADGARSGRLEAINKVTP